MRPIMRCLYVFRASENAGLSTTTSHTNAAARTTKRTVVWNLSKRADNASRLVQPETFDMLFNLLSQDKEEGDVLRRIVSCIQNLAAIRRYACGTALTKMADN